MKKIQKKEIMKKDKKIQNNIGEDYKKILDAVNDFIFENHRVCGLEEISTITEIPKSKCSQLISNLEKQKKLYKIYFGNGKPDLYIPYLMMQGVLSLQPKPDWTSKYFFKEKTEDSKKIEELERKIAKYEEFERLLYTTDKPFEKAVAFCLDFLGFDDVKHLDDEELHDIEFKYKKKLFLVETKGKTKQGDKGDVQQLKGWVEKKLEEGVKKEDIEGVLVVNHYRNEDPSNRGDPLTDKAIQFLKYGNHKFFTGIFLFDIIKEVVEEKLNEEKAREKIANGENY